ncbi:MAG: PIN domain-containing protein [Candidatus Binatia bacterium]|jgi:predicted nucleic acid-binding protein
MKLVDTSAWIHQMRSKGDPLVRARVEALLQAGEAAWCAMVRLEVWAGVGNERERSALREYEAVLPNLAIDDDVWQAAFDLASRARRAGKTIPPSDILIHACARHHGTEIEHADAHFDMLATLDSAA